jgi:tripartite ATP-independent transporter DctP family solute receptor
LISPYREIGVKTPIHIRFAGYSPPDTTHSRAVSRFRDELTARLGSSVRVDLFWNVFDFGYKGMDLTNMVERGQLTMCYSSTGYGLSDLIPELRIIDLPFFFDSVEHAHRALDGELGAYLTRRIESQKGCRILGYWDNGFRHISNRLRPIRTPEDCAGLRIRLMPNEIHKKTFELIGAAPFPMNLERGLAMMASGELDAQENPLANTSAYGINKYHEYITMTGHFYAARAIFTHKQSFDSWPEEIQAAVRESIREAILFQREIAQAEEIKKRGELESAGISFVDLTAEERSRFENAVSPIVEEARGQLPEELFRLAARR